MNVIIRDMDALSAIRPVDTALYLRSQQWDQVQALPGRSSTWTFKTRGEEFEALLPMNVTLRDYALRMGELLNVLSVVENRSQSQIYRDLLTVSADVLRIRIADPALTDGTLSLEEHAQVAQKARDLILAAACAATEPRAVWHKRKPSAAMEYMRQVRMGQSERGSYVVTIISRITPELHQQKPDGQMLLELQDPFERKVTTTLARSLQALGQAAERASLNQEMRAFDEVLALGVNANLCDAVVGIWGDSLLERTLEFSFSWSPGRAVQASVPRRIHFSSDKMPIIREAGKLMREREPFLGFELRGPVFKLERPEGSPFGKATIMALVEDRQARVLVELASSQYDIAVNAHRDGHEVLLTGTLIREKGSFVLKNAGDIAVEPEA